MSGHPQGGHYDDGYGQQGQHGQDAYYDDHQQGYYDTQDYNNGHQGQGQGQHEGYYDESYAASSLFTRVQR
jgi:1,3-beta-glucan synthase